MRALSAFVCPWALTLRSLSVTEDFDYCFAENGLTAIKLGKTLSSESFIGFIGEEKYQKLVSFILHYIADLVIPVKRSASLCSNALKAEGLTTFLGMRRGTFVEFRNGMVKSVPAQVILPVEIRANAPILLQRQPHRSQRLVRTHSAPTSPRSLSDCIKLSANLSAWPSRLTTR